MPFLIPIENSGVIPIEEREVIYSSLGGLQAIGSNPVVESFAGFELSGEGIAPGIGGHRVRAENFTPSISSIEQGTYPAEPSIGAITSGTVLDDPSYEGFDVSGESLLSSFAALVSQNNPSLIGSLIYHSLAVCVIRSGFNYESFASIRARESRLSRVFGSLAANSESYAYSGSTFETGAKGEYPASSSLDTGGDTQVESLAAMDAAEGDGITIILDIIDSILYGGHGDDC